MKNLRFFTFVLILGTLVLSACGAVTATPTAAPAAVSTSTAVEAMPVTFVGIVDSIAGDQWVISGTTVTVHKDVVRDGPFNAGDQVKVEGLVHPDGSFTILRVEAPTPQETATLPPLSADNSNEANSNANTNDANVNDGNINDDNSNEGNTNDDNGGTSNDDNSNDDNGGGNTNDDHSNDDNSNDDNGGNSNDDNSNDDDDSGKGNDNDDDKDDNDNDD
jgi:hypothetical protein